MRNFPNISQLKIRDHQNTFEGFDHKHNELNFSQIRSFELYRPIANFTFKQIEDLVNLERISINIRNFVWLPIDLSNFPELQELIIITNEAYAPTEN